ncbi:MAG: FtsQ-type POTRA domain-containing protein [Proteobacteria bacterium]|nr:MAG: FtsQ-type POTRA domain-containing protein [Pseudomonadota bacterium]
MKASVSRTFVLVGLPLTLLIVGLIWGGMELRRFLFTSPRFAVQEVEVATVGKVGKEAILQRAAVPARANIFKLDLDEVKKRVEEEPWIYSATVVRALPNKIQIHYREQVPKAILGAGSMYYLNAEGKPFYRIGQGDSLAFPLIQVEGKSKDSDLLRQRVESALAILEQFRSNPLFTDKDLGDLTVRPDAEDGAAPFLVTLRFPPKALEKKQGKGNPPSRLYTVSFSSGGWSEQVNRWEAVVRYLAQQGKNPRLIRLELGKKVVVKVER